MLREYTFSLIILLLIFSTTIKANSNNMPIAKTKTALVSHGLDLDGFEDALLVQIFSYENAETSISRYSQSVSGERAFALMSKQLGIDIIWGSATNERFKSHLSVKIPIYKGLIGWRLALVKQANKHIFANVSSLDDLRAFNLGQGYNWSDYKIYKENGFTITSGANPVALAKMLVLGRFDFFPRAVIEFEKELREFANMGITLDPHLLIRYKSAYVFYVAKNSIELAKTLTDGLLKSKADGSFDRLFNRHFKTLFERLDLPNRRIIQLNNPLLPNEMLDLADHFWISPKTLLNNASS